jgi:hypothetical protein
MKPINKYEAIGVFGSVAIMALALVLLRFDSDTNDVVADITGDSQGAVVVAGGDTAGEQSGLTDALIDAVSSDGELASLVIDDVVIGNGRSAETGDTLVVDYIGTTQDGVQFDSSYKRGTPYTFTLGEGTVIEGWEKGLIDMKVGGQRILVIPSDMAYGNRQVGPIAPNSILVFTVELREIK